MTESQRSQLILIMGILTGIKKILPETTQKDLVDFCIKPLEKITECGVYEDVDARAE